MYKNYEPFPPGIVKGRFYFDINKHALLIPFRGYHVPFHIITIKSVIVEDISKRKKEESNMKEEQSK